MTDGRDDTMQVRLVGRAERWPVTGEGPVAVEFELVAEGDEAPHPAAAGRPLNVGIAIDRSGSMTGAKLAAAREATIGLCDGLADGERLAVAAFDNAVATVHPSVVLDDAERARLRAAVQRVRPGGSTALFDGFARAAELVARGAAPDAADGWTVILSDGMGNHGLTDPARMRTHAAALAERGIRTITVGIGADYQSAQLVALADGGNGEFHHASEPSEIVEIVLGELRAVRQRVASGLRLRLAVEGARRWTLLGGIDGRQDGPVGMTRFDRLYPRRGARVVALLWPDAPGAADVKVTCDASWTDAADARRSASATTALPDAPPVRDLALAARAARLWHAALVARAVERNEARDYEGAQRAVRDAVREFLRYAEELPDMGDLRDSLAVVARRAGRAWEGLSRKEAYVMARKGLKGMDDLRESAPGTFSSALRRDDPDAPDDVNRRRP